MEQGLRASRECSSLDRMREQASGGRRKRTNASRLRPITLSSLLAAPKRRRSKLLLRSARTRLRRACSFQVACIDRSSVAGEALAARPLLPCRASCRWFRIRSSTRSTRGSGSRELGASADRLADVPAEAWDALALPGVDAVWLMGVWERSEVGRGVALRDAGVRRASVPRFRTSPTRRLVGSPYCIRGYEVDSALRRPDRPDRGARRARRPRAAAHPRLRAEPRRARPSVGARRTRSTSSAAARRPRAPTQRVRARRGWSSPSAATRTSRRGRTSSSSTRSHRDCGRPRRDAARHRRTVRRRALRHGDADAGRRLRAHLGRARPATARRADTGRGDRGGRGAHPDFLFIAEAYWDLEWELLHRASTTATTSGSTTDCSRATPAAVRGAPARRPGLPAAARALPREPRRAARRRRPSRPERVPPRSCC